MGDEFSSTSQLISCCKTMNILFFNKCYNKKWLKSKISKKTFQLHINRHLLNVSRRKRLVIKQKWAELKHPLISTVTYLESTKWLCSVVSVDKRSSYLINPGFEKILVKRKQSILFTTVYNPEMIHARNTITESKIILKCENRFSSKDHYGWT